jgi:GNAT superfamily N-acetyltransferase
METIEAVRSELLTRPHIGNAIALSNQVGWNQTSDDWDLFIVQGKTRGIFHDGELIATAAALPYEPALSYVSMVLVAPRYRRHGIASRLLAETIDDLDARGFIVMLDATPAGAHVYRRLGFEDVFSSTRWQGTGSNRPDGTLRQPTPRDIEQIITLDAAAFGASRQLLLRNLLARLNTSVLVSEQGFVVRREGMRADQIGPLVAPSADDAQKLLSAALALRDGPVFLDLLDHHQSVAQFLKTQNFLIQRPFIRMARPLVRCGAPERLFLVAGPEFG